jgi:hypothetical protein
MTIPLVAAGPGKTLTVVNAMAATTAVLTRSGADVVVNGTSGTAYNLPAGETVTLRAGATGTNVYVEHGGSGNAEPTSIAFSELLTLSGNTTDVYAGENGGVCVTGLLAGATHVVGSTHVRRIPSGTATAIVVATDLDPNATTPGDGTGSWDTFDTAADYVISIYCTNATGPEVIASGKVARQTATAPVIVSATVEEANPNALVVVWSLPVWIESLTGLSLSFVSGTTRTITAVESGNGTATVTFTLSGNFDGTESASFVGSGRVAQSPNGPLVTVETEAIDNAWAYIMPGAIHIWNGDSITTSGGDLLTVADQVGSATLTAGATKPTTTTLGGHVAWTHIAGSYLQSPTALGEDMSDFAILMVVDFSTVPGSQWLIEAGKTGAETTPELALVGYASQLFARRVDTFTGDLTPAFTDTNPTIILYTGTATGAEVYIKSTTAAASNSTAADAGTIGRWTVGDNVTLDAGSVFVGGVIGEIQIGTTHLTGAAKDAALNAMAAKFGITLV